MSRVCCRLLYYPLTFGIDGHTQMGKSAQGIREAVNESARCPCQVSGMPRMENTLENC
jgi:hypothetical protein